MKKDDSVFFSVERGERKSEREMNDEEEMWVRMSESVAEGERERGSESPCCFSDF